MKLGKGHNVTFVILAATVVLSIGVALAASGSRISKVSRVSPGTSRASFALAAAQAAPAPAAQAAPANKPMMSEEVFKNVQVLKGMPVDDFMHTMGIMSASLSMCCNECHTGAGTDAVKWEDDTPRKRRARQMVEMVFAINKQNFAGRQVVTCWTCHRGRDMPVVTPSIDMMYGEPILEADDVVMRNFQGEPLPEAILDKYIQALGGAQRLATMTSISATGSSVGFGGFGGGGQVRFFAKAPDQRALFITFPIDPDLGNNTRVYNGREGWMATPLTVLGEHELGGTELDGARMDAQLAFPGQIKQVLTRLRTGAPETIEGRNVQTVQGLGPRGLLVTLYFDKETGLLSRTIRYGATAIGRAPTQVDYSDYRTVNGVKIPHRWVFGWLDGRDTIELKDVRVNAAIDPAVFNKPTPAKK